MAKRFGFNQKPGGPPRIELNIEAWLGLMLVLAVAGAYLPVLKAGFVWDDSYHVTANPCVVGPLGFTDIWTSGIGRFFPLALTTFWLEHTLWGLNPLLFHVVNVVQQAICAILLWRVLRILLVPGAWVGAALWALHPLQVESVAWISELKNTQSGIFYLLTVFFFVRSLQPVETIKSGAWNYPLTLLCAALAMATKSSTVVLPAVLVLCAWWMEGRVRWRPLLRLLPIVLMSVISALVTVWPTAADRAIPVDPQWAESWPQRLAISGNVFWFYLGKMIWPHPLMAVYPRWQIDAGQWTSYVPLAAAIIFLVVLWLKRNSWARPAFFAFAYYLVVISPFLGLIDQTYWRYSFVEDHLQYLAAMGPLALIGAGWFRLAEALAPRLGGLRSGVAVAVLVILGLLSWQRATVFENSVTLWTDAVAKNPNCWAGYNNLGQVLMDHGNTKEAMADYQKALAINPNDAEALINVGIVLYQNGQIDAAIGVYQKALKINPRDAEAYNNLGNALLQKGALGDAIVQYRKAIEMNPFYVEAHNDLGVALAQNGQLDEGIVEFQEAVRLKPDFSGAQQNLANAQAMLQHPAEGK